LSSVMAVSLGIESYNDFASKVVRQLQVTAPLRQSIVQNKTWSYFMNFKELEKMIKADGWILDRVNGSHHQYEHPTKPGILTIPRHTGDIDPYIVKSTLKRAKLI